MAGQTAWPEGHSPGFSAQEWEWIEARVRRYQSKALAGQRVWCVVCVEPEGRDAVHIFSSPEKANEFCGRDPRMHVSYDYVIDCPERMEQATN